MENTVGENQIIHDSNVLSNGLHDSVAQFNRNFYFLFFFLAIARKSPIYKRSWFVAVVVVVCVLLLVLIIALLITRKRGERYPGEYKSSLWSLIGETNHNNSTHMSSKLFENHHDYFLTLLSVSAVHQSINVINILIIMFGIYTRCQ